MNERIRELAQQAGAHVSTRNLMSNPPQHVETVELWDDRIEKFAELIVRECIERIKRVGILEDIEIESDMMTNAIKEHFYGAE